MAKRKRKPASELVAGIQSKSSKSSWHDSLPEEDRQYIQEVVQAIVRYPGVALQPIAKQLIHDLQIDRGTKTVTEKLKELISAEESA